MLTPCPSCGPREWKAFDDENSTHSHRGLSAEMKGLAGWRCSSCGEVVFDKISARRYAEAGDELVADARIAERAKLSKLAKAHDR